MNHEGVTIQTNNVRSGRKMTLFTGIALILTALAPAASADLMNTCTEDVFPKIVRCPGAPPIGSTVAVKLDETTPNFWFVRIQGVLTLGDVVFCDGFALPNNAGCDAQGISDILHFEPGNDITETLVTWLSDLDKEGGMEFGHPDVPPNNTSDRKGCCVPNLNGNVLYFTEAGDLGGLERNIYTADNGAGGVGTYTVTSDNPEPSTLFLVVAGGALLIATMRRRLANRFR